MEFIIFNLIIINRYREIEDYSFQTAKSTNGKSIGHFTQLVWKGTKYFGLGIATMATRYSSSFNETFIVAMYSPPGNWLGHYSANVDTRKDGCSGSSCKQHLYVKLVFHTFIDIQLFFDGRPPENY